MNQPQSSREQWDFSYLSDLEDQIKRVAVLYEYARENAELCEWVLKLREIDSFKKFPDLPPHLKQTVASRMQREFAYLSLMELMFLVSIEGFPSELFAAVLPQIDPATMLSVNGGTISKPLPKLIELPDGFWHRNQPMYVNTPAFLQKEQSAHIFLVPWKDSTNEDLVLQFRKWLEKNRPQQSPECKKRGRNSGQSDGANHKLNQLAAYRFDIAGCDRVQARIEGFLLYNTEREWRRAIEEATDRIKQVYQPKQ